MRYPLTGAGTSADGATLWLVTVDGRAPARSIGITRPMLASLFSALGASDAMAFDSGGSTEMVVRHLGDPRVTIANVPSDGRERSIADGLFVVNAATPGTGSARVVLRSRAPAVLVGSHLAIAAEGVDANDQPVAPDGRVTYSLSSAGAASIDADGLLSARAPGVLTVTAHAGQARGDLTIAVVPRVDSLRFAGLERAYAPASVVQLQVAATRADGSAIAVDPEAVHWSATGDGGLIDDAGAFRSSGVASRADVVARAGGARAAATLLVGAHEVGLESSDDAGKRPRPLAFDKGSGRFGRGARQQQGA